MTNVTDLTLLLVVWEEAEQHTCWLLFDGYLGLSATSVNIGLLDEL